MGATRLARRLPGCLLALWRRLTGTRSRTAQVAGLLGGALAGAGPAEAATLPEDRADAMFHVYDGEGLRASGPALLVRKKLADRVSLSAAYYVDMVTNASIDVVTTASPYKETRNEYSLGLDYVVRDSSITVSTSDSKEPDYHASATSVDVSQEVFGGMSSISLGFTRGYDKVGMHGYNGFFDTATHWRYRLGLTQILSPTWIASANFEAIADDGFLGSPYRVARVFGASVPERNPRTRSSRALQFRAIGDIGNRTAIRGDYRYFWDTWGIRAHTFEGMYSRYFGEKWLIDWTGRFYTQRRALFYSDNATADTLYLSRNRQLGTFKTMGAGARASYLAKRVSGGYEIRLNAAYELIRSRFSDFTDVRTGKLYEFDAHVLQLFVTANF